MGNILGAQQQPNIPFVPNIPVRADNQNDINRPHSIQMRDMFVNFGVPLFYITAFAIREYRLARHKEIIQEQTSEIADLTHQLTVVKDRIQELQKHQETRYLLASLESVEEEEDVKYKEKLEHLKYYEDGLETILDIRCSMFKPRDQRQVIEDDLINRLADNNIGHVVKYTQLRDIYTHDYKFCGSNRKENGKLRQLYVQQWRHQLAMEKHDNIMKRMKDNCVSSEEDR